MRIDACHWSILISKRIYVEQLICTLLNNQNVSYVVRIQLIKRSSIYAIVNSEDTFIENIIQVKI